MPEVLDLNQMYLLHFMEFLEAEVVEHLMVVILIILHVEEEEEQEASNTYQIIR